MNTSTIVIRSAVASLLALGLRSGGALAVKEQMEKCGGIVTAGKNDCGTSSHSCAAQSKADGGKDEWIYLPRGTCERIIGGTLIAKK